MRSRVRNARTLLCFDVEKAKLDFGSVRKQDVNGRGGLAGFESLLYERALGCRGGRDSLEPGVTGGRAGGRLADVVASVARSLIHHSSIHSAIHRLVAGFSLPPTPSQLACWCCGRRSLPPTTTLLLLPQVNRKAGREFLQSMSAGAVSTRAACTGGATVDHLIARSLARPFELSSFALWCGYCSGRCTGHRCFLLACFSFGTSLVSLT